LSILRTALQSRRKLFWSLAVVTFLLDQLTKLWLWHHPAEGHPDLVVIPHLLRIVSHAGNLRGVLGLGPAAPAFYVATSAVALGVVGFFFLTTDPRKAHLCAALGLVAGGAVGNLLDRLAYGRVRDFIDLHWGEALHWHTFNVADAAICAGVALILCDALFARTETAEARPSGGPEARR